MGTAEEANEELMQRETFDDLVAERDRLTEERDALLVVCKALVARYNWYQ